MATKVMQYLHDLQGSIRKRGLVSTVKLLAPEVYFDLRYGTDTFRLMSLDQMKDLPAESKVHAGPYQGANLLLFKKIFSQLDLNLNRDFFIDFGCGKGRALLMASQLGFKKVLGVEFSEELVSICKKNIRIFNSKNKSSGTIEVVHQDAMNYLIPPDSTVFFFFNPFQEPILSDVIENILQSLKKNPRPALFIYMNPTCPQAFQKKGLQESYAVSIAAGHKDAIIYRWTPDGTPGSQSYGNA